MQNFLKMENAGEGGGPERRINGKLVGYGPGEGTDLEEGMGMGHGHDPLFFKPVGIP